MDRPEFLKKRWSGYERIDYIPKRKDKPKIECFLIGIDFENELFNLEPIPDSPYEPEAFWARVEYCQRPIPKLKISKPKPDSKPNIGFENQNKD